MPHEITEFRKDDDTYHVVLRRVNRNKDIGLATAVPSDETLEAMPEGEKMDELLKRAKAQLKLEDEDVPPKMQRGDQASEGVARKGTSKKRAASTTGASSKRQARSTRRKPAS